MFYFVFVTKFKKCFFPKLIEFIVNCANATAMGRGANFSFDQATCQKLTFEESSEISLDGTVFLFASSPKQQGYVLCMLGTV